MIDFPTQFPIKIIFQNVPGAVDELIEIVRRHHPELSDDAIKKQVSQNNTYLSITATVLAKDQVSLDALYQELSQYPHIKMVL